MKRVSERRRRGLKAKRRAEHRRHWLRKRKAKIDALVGLLQALS